ncbi:hypothetical protein BCR37DRAFT_375430 [Protomyces lactucae-debilis]|uniref:Small acidic protein-like domain-containing protein n=1 Tax=Protomyces lactucae-debilis TaxID=2754530 RepID=A0A1Y2FU74_PROLT|nr:uncharacterized protein BCR37DRAFT_375430 [Protomyces lactucae-debilis]ORY87571.1 hypothetical protein BCR37DRAFT_375430 [Protomyces lactucae-debilis]
MQRKLSGRPLRRPFKPNKEYEALFLNLPIDNADLSQIAKIEAERERKRLLRQETDVVAKRTRPSSTGAAGSWADGAASSLGEKSAKFMKLMGGGKAAGEVTTESLGAATDNKPDKAVKKARKAEAELEKQFKSGMQAKQSGSRRTGLGA